MILHNFQLSPTNFFFPNLMLVNLVGFTMLSFNAPVALAESPTDIYPAEFAQQYRKNCLSASSAEGLSEPDAEELCECTLTKFQQEYSFEDFQELSSTAEENQDSANALVKVGESCFESILFEE